MLTGDFTGVSTRMAIGHMSVRSSLIGSSWPAIRSLHFALPGDLSALPTGRLFCTAKKDKTQKVDRPIAKTSVHLHFYKCVHQFAKSSLQFSSVDSTPLSLYERKHSLFNCDSIVFSHFEVSGQLPTAVRTNGEKYTCCGYLCLCQ